MLITDTGFGNVVKYFFGYIKYVIKKTYKERRVDIGAGSHD